MRADKRKWAALALALLLILLPAAFSLAAQAVSTGATHHHREGPAATGDMETVPTGTLQDLRAFETNLPVVVVDFYGEPAAPTVWNEAKGYRVPVERDPFVEGTFTLYDSKSGVNRLTDVPVLATGIRARLRGNSSLEFAKRQYLIKMYDEEGGKNKLDVLGMGAEWEWILNISYIDKSLLRNYVCLNLAAEIMGYAPEVRFCEVFEKDEDQYQYQGLYLMMESVKQGADRLPIAEYDPHFAESSYLLVRDRFEEDGVMLDTYATKQGLTPGYLGVKYPGESEITSATIAYIEEDISRLERALYAEDIDEFLAYRDYIDVSSFVDYFVVNEFFANYDAGFNSYYMYKDIGGKLTLGPVWDYDQAIDNNQPFHLDTRSTAMHSGVWFDRLLRDGEFVSLVVERYAQLRRGILSDASVVQYIDDTIAFLGKAQLRDWNRWQYSNHEILYQHSPSGKVHETLLSNTRSYAEEVANVKAVLQAHGAWLDKGMESLYQFSEVEPGRYRMTQAEPVLNVIFGDDRVRWMAGSLVIMLMIVLFSSICLIQRET